MSQEEAQALLADTHRTRGYVCLALNEGATPREILESLEAVIAPMGALAVRRGLRGLGGPKRE